MAKKLLVAFVVAALVGWAFAPQQASAAGYYRGYGYGYPSTVYYNGTGNYGNLYGGYYGASHNRYYGNRAIWGGRYYR